MRIAAVFPGQGSHRPGVLDAWLAPGADGLVATRALVDQVSASIGRDVVALAADETTGGRTADAQPAI
ncbi:MAG: hypothetical protein WD152_03280, partial [Nitriliruptoraceae bacterium]